MNLLGALLAAAKAIVIALWPLRRGAAGDTGEVVVGSKPVGRTQKGHPTSRVHDAAHGPTDGAATAHSVTKVDSQSSVTTF